MKQKEAVIINFITHNIGLGIFLFDIFIYIFLLKAYHISNSYEILETLSTNYDSYYCKANLYKKIDKFYK